MHDVRLAFRLLFKSPAFTALVLVTLALGIGVNTAIFSVVTATCLRPLPYPAQEQLVSLFERSADGDAMSVSYPNFEDWQKSQDVFGGLAIFRTEGTKLKTLDGAEQVTTLQVSAEFFDILGVRVASGRNLTPDDDRPGASPVLWLTHGAWQRYFRGAADLVGSTVVYDGQPTVVAGILPPDFRFHRRADVFVPVAPRAASQFMRERENHNGTSVIARLKPGVPLDRAQAQMTAIAQRLQREYPKANAGILVGVVPLRERLQGDSTKTLYLLLGAVGMVLLIACVNVANMLLARSFSRGREMAIRTALGATRADLFRQLMTESLLLAAGGGVLGVLVAQWGYDFVSRLAPSEIRQVMAGTSGFDASVWAFTALLTLITGVGFGLAPAWQLSHANPNDALKNAATSVRTWFGRFRISDLLVVVQVAIAVTLLVGAGLLIRSLQQLASVSSGLQPDRVLTLRVSTPPAAAMTRDPNAFIRFHEAVVGKVQALGEVQAAAFVSSLPYSGDSSSSWFFRPDRPRPEPGKLPNANSHVITSDYFKVMGIPVLRGSTFTGSERRPPLPEGQSITMQRVAEIYRGFTVDAVISRRMAEKYWPGEDPIGKTFQVGHPDMKMPQMRIIGVVGDTTQFGAENGVQVEFYTLLAQWPATMGLFLTVRTQGEPAAVVGSVRAAIRSLFPDEPIFDVKLMTERVAGYSSNRRFSMGLFTFFAATALLLAAVGIYGVLACLVGQRTRDIGIRMALGAQRSDVMRDVLIRGLTLVLPGIGCGLVMAWAGSRVIRSQLFGVTPTDVTAYAVSGLVLLGAALLACAIPARRASHVSPIEALRTE